MNKKLAVLLISFLIFNPVGWGPASSPPSAAAADTWQLVWSDEFDGPNGSAPDPTKWNLIDAGGGFGNNELQYYTRRRDNSYLENGSLVIVAKKENYNNHAYTSAKLTSQYKGDWKYGRFEIRAKLPYGRGMWPAIWMMPTDSVYGGWPKSGEIDIMENRGDQMNKVSGTIHYGNDWPNNQWSGADYFLPAGQSFADAYHTFAVEWEEGVIRWYVDGVLYSTKTSWFTPSAPYPAPFDQRFYLILNLAIGGPNTPFTGFTNPDDSVLPQKFYIDYVRVYAKTSSGGGSLVALDRTGWTATSSPAGSGAANMLDGSLSTRWTTGTAMAPGQYVVVDMQAAKTFRRIVMDSTGSNNDYARGYEVYVSNDGVNWGSAIASGTGTGPVITVDFAVQTARYIKIVQTGSASYWWSIHELNVYADGGSGGSLVALDRTGWTVTTSPAGSGAANMLDGSLSTRWTTGTAMAPGQYVVVDMQAAKTFRRIVMDSTGSNNDYARGYEVYVSNDGVNWGSAIASGTGTGPVITVDFAVQTARYIKIVQTGSASYWWSIHELNVYADGGSGGSLVALDRTGWTVTTSPAGSGAANMLDGSLSTRWTTGTAMAPGQYVVVDMQAAKTFRRIVMDSTGSNNDYARGYEVYVSNDGVNWGSAIASGTGTGPVITVDFAVQTARYIKIVQTGSASYWWSIHELNVYN